MSGHLNEALLQLEGYQLIADRHFGGSITIMVEKYLLNQEASIKETANIISNTSIRVDNLQAHLFNIQETQYVERVFYFITQFDQSMAQATIAQYQLAIPLSLSAFITGTLFALCILLILNLLISFMKLSLSKMSNKNSATKENKKIHRAVQLAPVKVTKEKSVKISPRIGDINNI